MAMTPLRFLRFSHARYSVLSSHFEATVALIALGADLGARNSQGKTAADLAREVLAPQETSFARKHGVDRASVRGGRRKAFETIAWKFTGGRWWAENIGHQVPTIMHLAVGSEKPHRGFSKVFVWCSC